MVTPLAEEVVEAELSASQPGGHGPFCSSGGQVPPSSDVAGPPSSAVLHAAYVCMKVPSGASMSIEPSRLDVDNAIGARFFTFQVREFV